ncbi:MAG TPA: UbiD family decarboxylase [Thermodesulfobacteriota bacterium]|nr:UbiD family decarboxylase [Thermodesulfobacteriota bacterium]
MNHQDWRTFIRFLEGKNPSEVLHVEERIDPSHEITAFMNELEKEGTAPVVIFDRVKGYSVPVVTNLSGSRKRLAMAFGVQERGLWAEYFRRMKSLIREKVVKESPAREKVLTGKKVDILQFPILTHFQEDPAPYLTAGLILSADPDSGVTSLGYHRLMVKGKNRFGISLHSRRRLWDYQRRAEERGKNLPIVCVLGVHPLISLSSIGMIPLQVGKYEVAGGLLGEPLEVVQGINTPLTIPAYAEIVLEGEILGGVREPEGPFGEFTGYSSLRSTQNVFVAHTLYHRKDPFYQSICAGLSGEHNTLLALPREADLIQHLSRTVPGLRAVHVPLSGCGLLHAYISMKKTAEGQGKQAVLTALGLDHCLKLVVVVDDDVDVFNEAEVLWALSTRFQADQDLVMIPGTMGVILDPSATENGLTARMGMDATKPLQEKAIRLKVPDKARETAQKLIASLKKS